MAPPERRAVHPRLEAGLVAPAGDHQPRRAAVGRLEELEALEAVLLVDGAGAAGEAPGQFVARVGGHGDGVDLHDGHTGSSTTLPARWVVGSHDRSPESSSART